MQMCEFLLQFKTYMLIFFAKNILIQSMWTYIFYNHQIFLLFLFREFSDPSLYKDSKI